MERLVEGWPWPSMKINKKIQEDIKSKDITKQIKAIRLPITQAEINELKVK